MPAITAPNNSIIPLHGVDTSADPTRTGTLLYQGNTAGVANVAWPVGGVPSLTVFYWTYRAPSGYLDFCFQFHLQGALRHARNHGLQ